MISFKRLGSPLMQNTARGIRGCSRTEVWEKKTVHTAAWQKGDELPKSTSAASTFSQQAFSWFQNGGLKDQVNYTEGFAQGYHKGKWDGRKETFFVMGSSLGLYSFIIHLRSGRKGS